MGWRKKFYLLLLGQVALTENSNLTHTQDLPVYTDFVTRPNPYDVVINDRELSPIDGYDFTDVQVMQGINTLNGMRSSIAKKYGVPNMLKVKPQWSLNAAEKEFAKIGAQWLYQDSIYPLPPGYGHYLNFEVLSQNATFRAIAAKYPGLLEFIDTSHLENLHDTSSLRPGTSPSTVLAGALQVLRLRFVSQTNCFVLNQCNQSAPFYNFRTCFISNSGHCAGNPFIYMGRGILPDVQYMTLVYLPVQGRFAKNQKQTGPKGYAFLFTLAMDKSAWPPLTDLPFTYGKQVCSECPPTHPICDNGLCTDTPPPTQHATGRLRI